MGRDTPQTHLGLLDNRLVKKNWGASTRLILMIYNPLPFTHQSLRRGDIFFVQPLTYDQGKRPYPTEVSIPWISTVGGRRRELHVTSYVGYSLQSLEVKLSKTKRQ